jgi:hypothetical protein
MERFLTSRNGAVAAATAAAATAAAAAAAAAADLEVKLHYSRIHIDNIQASIDWVREKLTLSSLMALHVVEVSQT